MEELKKIEGEKMEELKKIEELIKKAPFHIVLEKKIEQKEIEIGDIEKVDVITLKIALPAGLAHKAFAGIHQKQEND